MNRRFKVYDTNGPSNVKRFRSLRWLLSHDDNGTQAM